jgi:hypothetical protein
VVDTRWIDRFVINSKEPLEKIGSNWIEEYWRGSRYPWNGESDIPKEPLMECLVEGTAVIYGTKLRMEAYSLVDKLAPESVGILEKGRLGVDLCTRFNGTDEWRLGQIVPMLMTDEARKTLWVRNLIHRKVPLAGIRAEEINSQALKVFEKDTIRLPDLRILDVDLSWISQQQVLLGQVHSLLTSFFRDGGGDVEAARRLQQEHDQLRLANKLPPSRP